MEKKVVHRSPRANAPKHKPKGVSEGGVPRANSKARGCFVCANNLLENQARGCFVCANSK
jgi:hypothetical protein